MYLRNKFLIVLSLLTITTFLLFTGCESANDPADSGTLVVKVTDAPFPIDFVESATVTIDKVEVRQKDGTEDVSYIVVSSEPMDFDLLKLRNGITSALPEIDIPIGNYDLVRLYVEDAKIVLKDGLGEFDLKVPSGDETGIKVFLKPELQIQGGLTAELLLDFDLSKSFVVQGNLNNPNGITGFSFKPVVRAVNNSLAGSISGVISDENGVLEGVMVTVTLAEESASAITDENGYYEILGLQEGAYSVLAVVDGFGDGEESGVAVTANNKTEQNFVLVANWFNH